MKGSALFTPGSLAGDLVVVTGATRGIGLAIAQMFIQAGARVLGTGRNEGELERLAAEIGAGFEPYAVELTDAAARERFGRHLEKLPVTTLINNAGSNRLADIRELGMDDWQAVLDLNLTAPAALCRVVARGMSERHGGWIVNISSIWGVIARSRRNAYAASKAGLIGLTRTMALDLAASKVLVNAVCPGFTDTELTRRILGQAGIDQLAAEVPLRRVAQPEEIAAVVLFLGSRANTYLTGQAIVVDGGFSIQ